jgi:hypothetical protein
VVVVATSGLAKCLGNKTVTQKRERRGSIIEQSSNPEPIFRAGGRDVSSRELTERDVPYFLSCLGSDEMTDL